MHGRRRGKAMTNNDVLRRLRYALGLNNPTMIELFRLAEVEMSNATVVGMLKKEGEEGAIDCSDQILLRFLDGLIALKRGKKEGESRAEEVLDNNLVLRKLRIALELREEDMLDLFKSAGFPLSRAELSAFFRAKGQPNYKKCGDQVLRNFIKALTLKKQIPLREGKSPSGK